MIAADARGPDGEFRSRNRELVTDTAGVAVAELTVAPKLYVARALNAMRNSPTLGAADRRAVKDSLILSAGSRTAAGCFFPPPAPGVRVPEPGCAKCGRVRETGYPRCRRAGRPASKRSTPC